MRKVVSGSARGSLRWIRQAVNQKPELLNRQIIQSGRLPERTRIEWVSPLESDDYAEYRDGSFLEMLGIRLDKAPLKDFWPRFGPQWDALARTADGQVLLVEAKANVPEIVSNKTGALSSSKERIERSLEATKQYLGVDPAIPWSGKLYQYANRMAHLYLLRELNGIPAWLVFVYFIGDEDTNGPTTEAEWRAALTVAKGVLGLKRNRLNKYVIDVFLDVRELS
jgi:hypothetical protein